MCIGDVANKLFLLQIAYFLWCFVRATESKLRPKGKTRLSGRCVTVGGETCLEKVGPWGYVLETLSHPSSLSQVFCFLAITRSRASIMFPRHHALPKQAWTELSETMCQNKPFHLDFGMCLVQTTEGPKEKGSLNEGPFLARKAGRLGCWEFIHCQFLSVSSFLQNKVPTSLCKERNLGRALVSCATGL